MAIYAVNYDGLRKRDTYNELIDYLQFKQEKIIYPDRFAKRIRESPQISNLLDGEGLGKGDLEEQEKNRIKEILKEVAIIQAGGTAQFSRADPANNRSRFDGSSTPSDYDPAIQDLNDMFRDILIDDTNHQQQQQNNNRQQNQNHLNSIHEQNNNFLLGGHRLLPNNPVPPLPPPPAKASSSNQPMQYDIHTPKAKSEPKPKSLNLLRRQAPAPPPPAKAMNPEHPAGNFADDHMIFEAKQKQALRKTVPETPAGGTPTEMTNAELAIVNKILGLSLQELKKQLKALGLSIDGDKDTLVSRLATARINAPSAPIIAHAKARRRRIDTPT